MASEASAVNFPCSSRWVAIRSCNGLIMREMPYNSNGMPIITNSPSGRDTRSINTATTANAARELTSSGIQSSKAPILSLSLVTTATKSPEGISCDVVVRRMNTLRISSRTGSHVPRSQSAVCGVSARPPNAASRTVPTKRNAGGTNAAVSPWCRPESSRMPIAHGTRAMEM